MSGYPLLHLSATGAIAAVAIALAGVLLMFRYRWAAALLTAAAVSIPVGATLVSAVSPRGWLELLLGSVALALAVWLILRLLHAALSALFSPGVADYALGEILSRWIVPHRRR